MYLFNINIFNVFWFNNVFLNKNKDLFKEEYVKNTIYLIQLNYQFSNQKKYNIKVRIGNI